MAAYILSAGTELTSFDYVLIYNRLRKVGPPLFAQSAFLPVLMVLTYFLIRLFCRFLGKLGQLYRLEEKWLVSAFLLMDGESARPEAPDFDKRTTLRLRYYDHFQ